MDSKEYSKVIEILDKIPNYEDKEKIREVAEKEILYIKAKKALGDKNYDEVIKVLDQIPNHEDPDKIRETAEEELFQKLAEEYVIHVIENLGFHYPMEVRVIDAGYYELSEEEGESFDNAEGLFLMKFSSKTKIGLSTITEAVALHGGESDKGNFSNKDGNSLIYDKTFDGKKLNEAIEKHWNNAL